MPTFERDSMNLYVDLMHAFSGLLTTETEKPAQLPATVHENLIPMTGKVIFFKVSKTNSDLSWGL